MNHLEEAQLLLNFTSTSSGGSTETTATSAIDAAANGDNTKTHNTVSPNLKRRQAEGTTCSKSSKGSEEGVSLLWAGALNKSEQSMVLEERATKKAKLGTGVDPRFLPYSPALNSGTTEAAASSLLGTITSHSNQSLSNNDSSSSSSSSSNMIVPKEHDILFGRGKPFQEHPGNIKFNEMLEDEIENYESRSKSEKTILALDIIQRIRETGARFLKEGATVTFGGDPNNNSQQQQQQQWEEADSVQIREKVSHSFRSHRQHRRRKRIIYASGKVKPLSDSEIEDVLYRQAMVNNINKNPSKITQLSKEEFISSSLSLMTANGNTDINSSTATATATTTHMCSQTPLQQLFARDDKMGMRTPPPQTQLPTATTDEAAALTNCHPWKEDSKTIVPPSRPSFPKQQQQQMIWQHQQWMQMKQLQHQQQMQENSTSTASSPQPNQVGSIGGSANTMKRPQQILNNNNAPSPPHQQQLQQQRLQQQLMIMANHTHGGGGGGGGAIGAAAVAKQQAILQEQAMLQRLLMNNKNSMYPQSSPQALQAQMMLQHLMMNNNSHSGHSGHTNTEGNTSNNAQAQAALQSQMMLQHLMNMERSNNQMETNVMRMRMMEAAALAATAGKQQLQQHSQGRLVASGLANDEKVPEETATNARTDKNPVQDRTGGKVPDPNSTNSNSATTLLDLESDSPQTNSASTKTAIGQPKASSPVNRSPSPKGQQLKCPSSRSSSADDEEQTKARVSLPGPNDILFGRGKPYQEHAGNRKFNQLLRDELNNYNDCSKSEKVVFAVQIVQRIKSEGGRFMKESSDGTGMWEEVDGGEVRGKVAHSLRSLRRHQPKKPSPPASEARTTMIAAKPHKQLPLPSTTIFAPTETLSRTSANPTTVEGTGRNIHHPAPIMHQTQPYPHATEKNKMYPQGSAPADTDQMRRNVLGAQIASLTDENLQVQLMTMIAASNKLESIQISSDGQITARFGSSSQAITLPELQTSAGSPQLASQIPLQAQSARNDNPVNRSIQQQSQPINGKQLRPELQQPAHVSFTLNQGNRTIALRTPPFGVLRQRFGGDVPDFQSNSISFPSPMANNNCLMSSVNQLAAKRTTESSNDDGMGVTAAMQPVGKKRKTSSGEGMASTPSPITPQQSELDRLEDIQISSKKNDSKVSTSAEPTGIDAPTEIDVLFGRGKRFQESPGNLRMNSLMQSRYGQYNAATKRFDKTKLAIAVVENVKDYGGRFLRKRDDGKWEQVDDSAARVKVSHDFRTIRAIMKKESESTSSQESNGDS